MKSTLLALSVAVALGLSMTAQAEEAVTVKIGQSSPLTGPQAHIGKDNDNGVRLQLMKSTPPSR